jgi:SnoaL-like domain
VLQREASCLPGDQVEVRSRGGPGDLKTGRRGKHEPAAAGPEVTGRADREMAAISVKDAGEHGRPALGMSRLPEDNGGQSAGICPAASEARKCSALTAANGRSTDGATSGLPYSGPGPARPGDVVGRYQSALNAGDADAIVDTFAPDGYYREPIGPPFTHRGTVELHSFFTRCFSAGGGIGLEYCAVTDDGVRCALEFNCLRWGSHDLPPQAGLAVYERGPDGLLAAARVYHDIDAPIEYP